MSTQVVHLMNPFMLSNILESMVGIGQNWGQGMCNVVENKIKKITYLTLHFAPQSFLLLIRTTHGYRNIQEKRQTMMSGYLNVIG